VEAQLELGGPKARAWWHIDPELRAASLARGPRDLAGEHPQGLPHARERLIQLLKSLPELVRGFERCPLVLVGFSQGGMLACDTCLRVPLPLSGLVLFSTSRIAFDEWIPELERLRARVPPFPPVLISHGESDPDLAFATGQRLRDALQEAGASVTWVPFPGRHEIPLVVWRRLRKFLTQAAGGSER
jgi:phospholipase/carboxylesterase